MLITFSKQDELFTIKKTYKHRGKDYRCIEIIPISVNLVDGMTKKESSVNPVADTTGTVVRLEFNGIYKRTFNRHVFFLVATFATFVEAKSKIIAKNADIAVICKKEKCDGIRIHVEGTDYWVPCLWQSVKDKGSCAINKDKRKPNPYFCTHCFGCEWAVNNLQINPKVIIYVRNLNHHSLGEGC